MVPLSPYPCQHFSSLIFLIISILTGLGWYLIVVLTHISPVMLRISTCSYWRSVCLLQKMCNQVFAYYLVRLFLFDCACVLFCYWVLLTEFLFFNFILFNFTILYWFCHISKWICHRYTCVALGNWPKKTLLWFMSENVFFWNFYSFLPYI